MRDLSRARERMVEIQIARRGVRDRRVLKAMREVPREAFVEPGFEEFAYEDGPLPIGEGQTISQPYIVALMIEAAELEPGDRVLEVGAGSGYAAAVLSRIADRVHAIERHAALAAAGAGAAWPRLGYDNVELRVGDGTQGWPEAAPFDAILVAAGGPEVPAGAARSSSPSAAGWSSRSARRRRADAAARSRAPARPTFEEEDLGAVRVRAADRRAGLGRGRHAARPRNHVPGQSRGQTLPEMIAEAAEPLPDLRRSGVRARCSTASPTAASCCSARRATAPRNSTAPARRSRGG